MIDYYDAEPTPDLLRLQAVLTATAQRIIDFCEHHRIPVAFIGGTALGAVRDAAFIPWDDDIDLALTREDYRRFAATFRKHGIDGLVLQDWDSDPQYHLGFGRLRIDGTKIDEDDFAGTGMHEGIFIDLFIYDELPRANWLRRVQRIALGLANFVIMPPAVDEKMASRGQHRRFGRRIGLALRASGLGPPAIRFREWVSQWGAGSGSAMVDSFPMLGISKWRRTTLARADLLPYRPASLGNLEGHVPANAERFFELHYGSDWREPPPPEARKPAHVTRVDFGD